MLNQNVIGPHCLNFRFASAVEDTMATEYVSRVIATICVL
jgi:hypothetical protein